MSETQRLGAGRYTELTAEPPGVRTTVHQLRTSDKAQVAGILRRRPDSTTVVTIMHPRQDVTFHALVPYLLHAGLAVWTQGPRMPNNDLNLIHEQAIIDFAAGHVFLREQGFDRVVVLGHSGGGTLGAFYIQQASRAPGDRLTQTPSGQPIPLAETEMPIPDGFVPLAPHPGQGALLARVIDPSVTDESDPLSIDRRLSAFNPVNGFREAPETSEFNAGFVEIYRAAQRARIARIDEVAAELASRRSASRAAHRANRDVEVRRSGLAPALIPVYRTDADLRNIDLRLDPNQRPYGSLFGRRPDLTNHGLVGFGRLSTAEAWMSTWSTNTTNADFETCIAGCHVPTLLIEFTGDQASFPADIERFRRSCPATDLTVTAVDGTHFGDRLDSDSPTGNELAAEVITGWIAERF